jgi:hypothetical protein
MNKLERFVYDLVRSNPKVKKRIRNIYQGCFDLLPRKKNFSINPIILKEGFFFGFHDLQPFSEDNSKVLAVKYNYEDLRMPTAEDYVLVGYIKFDGVQLGEFIELGKTNAWNFHKGCRLQWIDGNRIIFNCTNSGRLVSKIINVNTKDEVVLPFAIDTVSNCGKYASSFSYERLEKHMPGYGYCHKDEYSFMDEKEPRKTGLFIINLESRESKLLVDLKTLSEKTLDLELSKNCDHYVTHTEFSHDSEFVSFFHRWSGEYKGKRFTEFMIYNLQANELSRLPTTNLMTSHYDWNKKREIIAYCNYKGQDAHVLFKIDDVESSHYVSYPEINSDGHQSFIDNISFVTDTYPDKWRMAKLYLVDVLTNNSLLIASVNSSKKFQSSPGKGHVACDLHPRVSTDGKYVCFDTVQTGKRALAVMKLK